MKNRYLFLLDHAEASRARQLFGRAPTRRPQPGFRLWLLLGTLIAALLALAATTSHAAETGPVYQGQLLYNGTQYWLTYNASGKLPWVNITAGSDCRLDALKAATPRPIQGKDGKTVTASHYGSLSSNGGKPCAALAQGAFDLIPAASGPGVLRFMTQTGTPIADVQLTAP
ncbi:hypothetical protein [Amantichitinum ursilacus]|uniref:Uncharacterized protein n=1 Tax=Amantichitinum ursilacus TaxID=857265 RepID=A0A0N1JSU6_9NEIS|nr:hypothetical protein [Amantichitinum ursilacus]KPC52577.1 hypothetical protein WG78_12055 [Amantichitinum ursilacus]